MLYLSKKVFILLSHEQGRMTRRDGLMNR